MMEIEPLIRWLHAVGAAVLLGTGAGIAFFMVMAHRTGRPDVIAAMARIVVIADFAFTATAVIAQPITGYWLARLIGWDLSAGWLGLSLLLYVVAGIFWLPVVWIQIQLRDMARASTTIGTSMPPRYHRLYRIWWISGFPAFGAIAIIYWLMLNRPVIDLP
jgi:uncharacterized membrane protein